MIFRSFSLIFTALFSIHVIFSSVVFASGDTFLPLMPKPGSMVNLSPMYVPPVLKGIKVDPNNPFQFDFILEEKDTNSSPEILKAESSKLIRYFLASLTVPEKDLWVNLSPYEKDRIVPDAFGQTEMGRDLLAQDYLLKQITASLNHPDSDIGKEFWKRVYEIADNKNATVNTFNKVWIVPDKATVYENAGAATAYVVESSLKVLTEQDYLATQKNSSTQGNNQIVRDVIIPQLNKEVNEGANFAQLRQVYNSLILATWYKKKIQESLLEKVYNDRSKVEGIKSDTQLKPKDIYQQYLKAFKMGAYNVIKEEVDPNTQQLAPRKYFSGGFSLDMSEVFRVENNASTSGVLSKIGAVAKRWTVSAVLVAGLAGGALFVPNESLAQQTQQQASQQQLESVQRMKAWLDDNVFKDDAGRGMPRLFRLPTNPVEQMNLWKSIGANTVEGVIERVIINDGVSTYDASVWQIAQAYSGNVAAASAYTDILASGSFGALQSIRAWDPTYFSYQGKTMNSPNSGLFFRLLSPRWQQVDPLNKNIKFPGFPGPSYDRDLITWVDWQPITGENAWIIIGNLQSAFVKYGGDKVKIRESKEFKLAESIYQAFDLMTSPIGAIYYAPTGTWGRGFAPDKNISTENNLSAYAALRMMYELTQDRKYVDKMRGIENYLRNHAWDKNKKIFTQGGQYEGGRFRVNNTFAVDVNTWGVAILGPEKVDQWFGAGTSINIWKQTKERSGYRVNNELRGVGYTDSKDVNSGEWTTGAIQMVLMMSEFYKSTNPSFSLEAEQDALTMIVGIDELSVINEGRKGYFYANKRFYIPFGWWANRIENTASTAWPFLILSGIDPFILGGKNTWSFAPAHLKLIATQRILDAKVRVPLPETARQAAIPQQAVVPSRPAGASPQSNNPPAPVQSQVTRQAETAPTSISMTSWGEGNSRAYYANFTTPLARNSSTWNIEFDWNGPNGEILVRLLQQGMNPNLRGTAEEIQVKRGKNRIVLSSNGPVSQLSFHLGNTWVGTMAMGVVSNVTYVINSVQTPSTQAIVPDRQEGAGLKPINMETWSGGSSRSFYYDFRPSIGKGLSTWTIEFDWAGPNGEIMARLLPEGMSPNQQGPAEVIQVKRGKNRIVLRSNGPIKQISFHLGPVWDGSTKAIGVISNVSYSLKDGALVSNIKQSPTGGIDLTKDRMNLEQISTIGGIKFRLDPLMVQQYESAPGFTPEVTSIKPTQDLAVFLGIQI